MKKITYSMELLSSLIVSPRAVQALYYGIDIFRKEPLLAPSDDTPKRTAKVVYPFYQYGEYKVYDPEHTEYYLPGSSVKGALLQKNGERIQREKVHMMADDILIDRKRIVLRNLEKAQNAVSSALVGGILIAIGYEVDSVTGDYIGELSALPPMLTWMTVVMGLIPVILAVIAVLIINHYPVDQAKRKEIQTYINEHQDLRVTEE